MLFLVFFCYLNISIKFLSNDFLMKIAFNVSHENKQTDRTSLSAYKKLFQMN